LIVWRTSDETYAALRLNPRTDKLRWLGDRGAIPAGAATKPGGSGVAPSAPAHWHRAPRLKWQRRLLQSKTLSNAVSDALASPDQSGSRRAEKPGVLEAANEEAGNITAVLVRRAATLTRREGRKSWVGACVPSSSNSKPGSARRHLIHLGVGHDGAFQVRRECRARDSNGDCCN
jgi:hypothetical protein